tara:strand:- start:32 stop:226 length:195 start_codon:yes stop_codon:yes gene_type:complete
MNVGDFIKFRFPFPLGGYITPWRYGIVISEYDKINETIEVLSAGKIIKVHEAAIEVQQKINLLK